MRIEDWITSHIGFSEIYVNTTRELYYKKLFNSFYMADTVSFSGPYNDTTTQG